MKLPVTGFVGSGNVATALATALHEAGYPISGVYSPSGEHCNLLARKINSKCYKSATEIEADLIFICSPDDTIPSVANQLSLHPASLVHTAGSVPLSALPLRETGTGVFYPVQTFSATSKPSFDGVTVCIESANEGIVKTLSELARLINARPAIMSSDQRLQVHLSAVFSGNFTNLLISIAADILQEKNIPVEILRPLMLQTVRKAFEMEPVKAQTGPAVRGDFQTIRKHLALLENNAAYAQLYELSSELIMKLHDEKLQGKA